MLMRIYVSIIALVGLTVLFFVLSAQGIQRYFLMMTDENRIAQACSDCGSSKHVLWYYFSEGRFIHFFYGSGASKPLCPACISSRKFLKGKKEATV